MKHGFVKVAAVTPDLRVADTVYNTEKICEKIKEASVNGAKIIVFPELCICASTCGDLFLQEKLLADCKEKLIQIAAFTEDVDALVFVGLPLEREGKLYNVAAVLKDGEVLGFVPKSVIFGYGEFSESRYFAPGNKEAVSLYFDGEAVPFGSNILFEAEGVEGLLVGCEIGEEMSVPISPSTMHATAGATVIVNPAAISMAVGKVAYRDLHVRSLSSKLLCGYISANAGVGESSTDLVFGGYNFIAEKGVILARSGFLAEDTLSKNSFSEEIIYGEIDVQKLRMERRRMNSFAPDEKESYLVIPFSLVQEETALSDCFSKAPFVPDDLEERAKRCEEILNIQAHGLKKRYQHIGGKNAVLGISGGLDSTLALLVTARCFDLLGLPRENILAVTMPCFGTTDRTYDNACKLTKVLGATLEEVDIKEAVTLHFRDIRQDMDNHNVTYENSQARERTQILMDIANRENALVIGTGDMSELALGWATYNGDHMSMYGVNAGVPKTLVRHLVQYYADTCGDEVLSGVLYDVLDIPVSPELLPPVDGKIAQKTEDLVGPYELHDFFLYYILRYGFEPEKVYRLAKHAFAGEYEDGVILKWLKNFYRRFFSQQFKRSCLPDGPKVGSVGVSPRGDLKMPSDACVRIWMEELEKL